MQLALLQLNPVVGALRENAQRIMQSCERAHRMGARLAITSELALPGYPPRDLLERASFRARLRETNQWLIDRIPQGMALIFGTVAEQEDGRHVHLFNSALFARRGEIIARVDKRLLPTYDVFDELRYFQPGEASAVIQYEGARIGISICEDAWNDVELLAERADGEDAHPQRLSRRYAKNPIADLCEHPLDLLVNLSASPFTLSKLAARPAMFAAIAQKRATPLAFVNQVGGNDELLFDGRSTLFGREGEVLARGRCFEEDLVLVDSATGGSVAEEPPSEAAAAYRALVMGTRDYVQKCGFSRAVLGLSGGIDSALTAAIAVDALGADRVLGVAMPSRYSSPASREDACELAVRLGMQFREASIEPLFSECLHTFGPILDELAPASPGDVAQENFQARLRATLLMGISNRTGAMLLTTGNKSEVAVGYCTLYGDMAGGLAVISDVPKTSVYALAHYVNREREIIPRSTLEKPPSAELRPNQTDQDSLPPYDVLDAILELYVEEARSRDEIVTRGFSREVVDTILSLVDRSEHKRRQAAPGLILTRKAFGSGRRMPLAQGYREF